MKKENNQHRRIPKIIHYCWFGGNQLPPLAKKCIDSWRFYFPEYKIQEWNEKNFDINCNAYVSEAYKAGKWAFVSDYARFYILYKYGGIYFDTDVEVIKNFDHLVEKGAFFGCQRDGWDDIFTISVAPGLIAVASPEMEFYREMIHLYEQKHFINKDGSYNLTTIVEYTTDLLMKHGMKNKVGIQKISDITIYPTTFFSPIDILTKKIYITENTYTIHHFSGSWLSGRKRIINYIKSIVFEKLGRENIRNVIEMKRKILKIIEKSR